MKKNILDQLDYLSSAQPNIVPNEKDYFDDPFDNDQLSPTDIILTTSKKKSKNTPTNQKPMTIDQSVESIERSIKSLNNNQQLDDWDFDDYIDDFFESYEDIEYRNTLIGMGRKYARSHSATEEESEVTNAFIKQEQILKGMLEEVGKDKSSLQKDIDSLRSATRSRNYRTISELADIKSNYHNTQLSIIKEMNTIAKTKFDIKYKAKKDEGTELNGINSTQAIQQLLGVGHSNLLGIAGGRAESSGAFHDVEYPSQSNTPVFQDASEYIENMEDNDELALKRLHSKGILDPIDKYEDGSFIDYEGKGVSLVLMINDETGDKKIIAEDTEGNEVPGYPVPTGIDELKFEMNDDIGTAYDQLHRAYNIKHI